MSEESQQFAEEVKEEKEQEALENKVVKVSELLRQQQPLRAGGQLNVDLINAQVRAQIEKNQELYTTLSRSLLEINNDLRNHRQKLDGYDRVIFGIQQGINTGILDLTNRLNGIEERLTKLTDLWNQAVYKVEEKLNAVNEEGEEDKESDAEDLREEAGPKDFL